MIGELVPTSHVDVASSPASSQIPLIEHLETVNNNINKIEKLKKYNY